MSEKKKDYESTVMRMAGNLLSGALCAADYRALVNKTDGYEGVDAEVEGAVLVARKIVAEVQRTASEDKP